MPVKPNLTESLLSIGVAAILGLATALPMLVADQYIVRGYNNAERIIYGTGQVVPTAQISQSAQALFERADVAYVHIRSATNNCFQCRIERA